MTNNSIPAELDISVLHVLRLKGRATAPDIATALAADEGQVSVVLAHGETTGVVVERTGRLAGWLLTSAGQERWARQNTIERSTAEVEKLADLYDSRFLELNRRFKELCARWQLSCDPAIQNEAVNDELTEIHRDLTGLLGQFTSILPRFTHYQRRFDIAISQFLSGVTTALLQPLTNSYHDIWLELHEDLLLLLGKQRDEDD